ncbi:MAG: CopD family protein [Alphaproteobacteria bacterium]|nr:CopD family protein [Alphaproteobacteria bacterium]
MSLLLDVFGFLDVLLRGASNVLQAFTIGGVIYLVAVIAPIERQAPGLARSVCSGIAWSAGLLAGVEAVILTLKGAVLMGTLDIAIDDAAGAGFALAGTIRGVAAATIALLAASTAPRRSLMLLASAAMVAAVVVLNNHAAGRLDNRAPLMAAAALHQLAAAAWIGGIPYFLATLARLPGRAEWPETARRFSTVCMFAVAGLLAAGLFKSWFYIGSPDAIWGTSYGAMTSTKALLFAVLVTLGAFNFISLRRAAGAPATTHMVTRRAEVELALGIAVFFAAASMTSLPPAVDLPNDRATWAEIADRMAPQWPRLSSPSHAALSIPAIQARLDAEAAAAGQPAPRAYIPGGGEPTPRNAEDIAWSEYNHHWAGMFVLAIGILSLIERTGRARWARSWPLLFIGLSIFLLIRSDPRAWPLGDIGFFEVMRDPEALQHRIFILLIAAFGIFEWSVRVGRITNPRAALVFPAVSMLGAGLLLAHSHALANVKEELLIELTHLPIALLGLATGAARWFELRVPPAQRAVPAMIWPICFVGVGLLLMTYREV